MTETILLVEDDPVAAGAIRRVLEAAEFEVVCADTTLEALRCAAGTPVAVAVLSLDLRDDAGASLVRALAHVAPRTVCILLSSTRDVASLADLYDLGTVYNHRWKPLDDLGDLAREIARALEHRAMKRQNAYLLAELRDARAALREQSERLGQIESLAALGQMSAGLSEELAAPLKALARYAGFIRSALAESRLRERSGESAYPQIGSYLGAMENAALQAEQMTERIERFAVGAEPVFETTDLNEVLAEAFGLLRHTLEARGIRLMTDLAAGRVLLHACAAQLQQAVSHLALNAVHAMPEGGALRLQTEVLPGDPGGVIVRLADSGTGIPPEALPHVFEPFFTTRPAGHGTGLGLTITREIVQAHEGEIALESAPGQGTTVTLTFPAVAALAPDTILARAA